MPESASANVKAPILRLLIVGLGTLVVPLDSAVNVDFPAIVARFALPIPMIQWIVITYVLTQTSLMLTFGRVGDMFGYRRVFLFGTAISTCAFVLCAVAPNYAVLLCGRVAQGVGAGLILSCGPALATSLFSEAERARAIGHYMLMFSIGSVLGPLLFGPLVQIFGWSSVFAFRAPVALLAFLLGWALPRSKPAEAPREPFDARGGALLALGSACLLLAINQVGHPTICVVFAVAAVMHLAAFYRHERNFAQPIIDFRLFERPGFASINGMNVLINLASFSIMLLAPFYLRGVADLSLPVAGLVLSVSPIGAVLGAALSGRLAGSRDPRLIVIAGVIGTSAGLLGIALASQYVNIVVMAAAMLLQGVGLGVFQVAYLDIVTGAIPPHQRGVAGALGMATRSVGTVTGATTLMLLFQSLRGSAQDVATLATAFQTTFEVAAALPLVLAVPDIIRLSRARPAPPNPSDAA